MTINEIKLLNNQTFSGERPLYALENTHLENVMFAEGESPLKHAKNISIENSIFTWKYPLWHASNIQVENTTFLEMARAGLWYLNNIEMKKCTVQAPKMLRRADNIIIEDCTFTDAKETLWNCSNVKLKNVSIGNADYFAMNSRNVEMDSVRLQGNYSFDGARDLHITNSTLISKDCFWNCENVLVENSTIIGEYIGWNSKNITLKNCTVQSLQGFCYIKNLVLEDCVLPETDLIFEYSTVKASINGPVVSIKNPIQAEIRADEIGEVILEDQYINPEETRICLS